MEKKNPLKRDLSKISLKVSLYLKRHEGLIKITVNLFRIAYYFILILKLFC